MLKQFIFLLALSLGIIFGVKYAVQLVHMLVSAHHWIATQLTAVFAGGQPGVITRGFISLLAIPLFIALIPTVIYWAVRRHMFPYFMEIIWVIWLVQFGALIMAQQILI